MTAADLPAFGQSARFDRLPLDARQRYGLLVLPNGNRDQMFCSYAAANPGGEPQMLSLGSGSTGMVVGIEDRPVAEGVSDVDYNDVLMRFGNVHVVVI